MTEYCRLCLGEWGESLDRSEPRQLGNHYWFNISMLGMFKRRWGERITLHGGISTTINNMSEAEIDRHVVEVVSVGRVGGRFFPRTESGISPMPAEKAMFYVNALKAQRERGYE